MSSYPYPSSDGVHVVDRLAEYFSGSLVTDEEIAVEAHLYSCADCRDEYDRLGEVALLLALDSAGTAPGPDVAAVPRQPSAPPARNSAPTGPTRPSGANRPPSRAGGRARLRRLVGYAAVLVLGAILGIAGMTLADRTIAPPIQPVDDSQDISTTRLSVVLVEQPGTGTQIQAAAVGLRPGRTFRLIAVDTSGQGYLVATGTADGGLQSITGTVPAPPDAIVFVALVEDGRGALLITRPA